MNELKMAKTLLTLIFVMLICSSTHAKHVTGRSCLELKQKNVTYSGVYSITPCQSEPKKAIMVYCDMQSDEGGWTVIQRRENYGDQENFTRSWKDYANGFGSIEKDFWLGNDVIHCLTAQHQTTVRFDLEDFEGQTKWAKYSTFSVGDREKSYKLQVSGYTGNANDSFSRHNGMKFSTVDNDNDKHSDNNCAQLYKGGWWYNRCHLVNLNGIYLKGYRTSFADGVNWFGWKGFNYSLKKTEIKIRENGLIPQCNTMGGFCVKSGGLCNGIIEILSMSYTNHCTCCISPPLESRRAVCDLQSSNPNSRNVTGVIEVRQDGPNKPVLISGIIQVAMGQDVIGKHGFHVHEYSIPSNGDCTGAAGHYNPFMKNHGAPDAEIRHVGDLGNIMMTKVEDGIYNSAVEISDSEVTLFGHFSVAGRGIVLHEGEDDLGLGGNDGSLTTGNAGARIACCTIKMVKPEDGQWSSWSVWGSCTKSCEGGSRQRSRQCNNPTPGIGGQYCSGSDKETEVCNSQACVHGQWSSWSVWGRCTKSCAGGSRKRTRQCNNNPTPGNGGQECSGSDKETEVCNSHPCAGWSSPIKYACIRRHNDKPDLPAASLEICRQLCEKERSFDCLSVEYNSRGTCTLSKDNKLSSNTFTNNCHPDLVYQERNGDDYAQYLLEGPHFPQP